MPVPAAELDSAPQIVPFAGELDEGARPDVADRLDRISPSGRVIVDLRRVTYLEASIVGLLIRLRNRLAQAEQPLCVVVTPGSWPERVFALTGTEDVLCVCNR